MPGVPFEHENIFFMDHSGEPPAVAEDPPYTEFNYRKLEEIMDEMSEAGWEYLTMTPHVGGLIITFRKPRRAP